MKQVVILVLLVLTGNLVYSQDCGKHKNGKYSYPALPGKISWRKDDVQESYSDGKLEMVWKVTWTSDCQYELVCTKLLVKETTIKVGDKILVIILSTEDACYTYRSTYYPKDSDKGIVREGSLCKEKE